MTNHPYHPHDNYFKKMMSSTRVAKQFFQTHLPKKIKEIIDLETLIQRNETYIEKDLQSKYTDLVYQTKIKGERGYLYTLVEHQSKPEKLMALRIWKYILAIIDKNSKGDKLPLVYPLIYYNGRIKYPYTTDLLELFINPEIAREILYNPIRLIDLSQIEDKKLTREIDYNIMAYVMKKIWDINRYDRINSVIKEINRLLTKVKSQTQEKIDYTTETFYYIISRIDKGDKSSYNKMLKDIEINLSPQVKEKLMSLADFIEQNGFEKGLQQAEQNFKIIATQLRQEGRQEGINLGKQEGRQEGKLEGINLGKLEGINLGKLEGINLGRQEGLCQTAERLLTETDFDDEKISQLTNLTVIEIKKLREKKKQSH